MKKQKNKQGIKASKLAKAENKLKHQAEQMITVKNAEGEPDTQAKILIQNKVNYTPKVSVIIPVYNVEEYLRECLDSVVNQTLKEIEIICVDDGSTDNSLEILKEYAKKDNRISVLTQENSGSGKSRNNGINNAKGEFIAFMDSDDFYPSHNTLENMYTKACKYNVNICGGSLNQLKEGKIITDPKLFEEGYTFKKEGVINYQDYQFDYGYWRFIYKRQFLRENQLYFPDYLRQQDPPFFIKAMATAQRFYALAEATYVYRVSHKNIQWTERKVVDMFKGIEDSLNYSSKFDLDKLHILQALRINAWTFRTALAETIKHDSVRQQATQAIQTIDFSLLKKNGKTIELDCIYKAILESKSDALISVIIPVYNVEKYLNRCMDSVITQTLKNLEIICINDGSTDNSVQILEDYAHKDKRIKIITQDNRGLSAARNVGIKQANCSFIYFIDSDDWIEKDTLEKAISKMTGNVDIVSWGANIINEGLDENNRGIIVGNQYHKIKIKGQKNIDENIILQSTYTVWNKLFKKEIINKFKIQFAEGRLFEDNDFTIMYMLHCRSGYYLDEYLYNYSQRPNSIMEKVRAGKCDKVIDNLYIFDNLYKHCEKYCILNKWKRLLTNRYLIHLRGAYLFAPINMKKQIREEATKLAKHYKGQMFTYPIATRIQKRQYHMVRELNEVIISLTSYPARIGTVNQTIESLLNQTMKADKVILWLAPEQFPNKEKDLPEQLLALCDKGLIIDWYHDIKSYKKLIPTLKKYPEAIIVTADDDLLYDKNWLSLLYNSYFADKNIIHCHRITRLYKVNNQLRVLDRNLYLNEKNSYREDIKKASYFNKLSGGAGTLYPPHSLHKDVLDEKTFMQLAPTSDDIWFYIQAIRNNYRLKVVNNNLYVLKYIQGTQNENCLCKINDINGNKIFYSHLYALIDKYQDTKQKFNIDELQNKHIITHIYQNKKNIYKQELQTWYQRVTGKYLNLDNPRTFNEKIQWLKLYDSTPIKTRLADKYLVRDWVKEKIGEQYLIPLLGVYDKFEEIDFDKLPNQFVVKCNHGCAYNIIVKDKTNLDLADVKAKLDKWMNENFAFKAGDELHYRDIKPKIVIEKYIENKGADDLYDYKFWCYNGKVKYIQFLSGRNLSGLKMAFYDKNWVKQDFYNNNEFDESVMPKPKSLDKMVELAEILSESFNYVRVDFYQLENGKIYFGEMTFTPASGSMKWCNEQINLELGKMIKLPKLAYNIDTGEYYKLPKKSKLKPYLLLPYNLFQKAYLSCEERKINRKNIQKQLTNYRIDIKNVGKENNALEITTSGKVSKPAWFINAQGQGQVVESNKKIQNITIKAIQDGKLRLDFKGQDKRFEGVRFPVWIEYKSIKIDGKEILSAPIATWHDKPFRYEKPVKDGQIVKVEVVQQYHQYSKDELKDVILKLNPNSDYIKENREKLTNKIYKKITFKKPTIKVSGNTPQTTLFARVKQNFQKHVNLWQDKLSFAHKIAPIMDLMQKSQAQTLKLLQEIQAKNLNLENKNNELKKEIEVLKGTFNTQLLDFKKQQEERSKQLMAIGDRLSTELQRATNELQSTEQTQASEIKATLSEFIAQLAVTENKLSTELQRTTAELQSAEQSQASEIKATLREFIAQLAVTENKLSAELQRATNELQSTEQSQASEIKATLSDFIAQLAATENKLSAEFQRMTTELQNAEKSQASEIRATLSEFIAQLAATENKLTAELQRATEKLQNSGISEISEIKTYCADFAQYLDNAQAKMLSELNNQRETALQNKNNIIAGINQTEQSLQMQASKSHELVQEQMAILDRVQERLEDLSALKEIDFAQKSELDVLSQDIEKQKSELLEKVQNLQNKAQLQYQELNFADLLHDSTQNSPWLKDKNFALYGWAANYSFIYTLFRILDNVQPAHILEMGLGQTSMVTTQYIANKKPAADLDIIENDESWIKVYEPKLAKSQNIKLHQCDIEFFDYEGEQSRKYKELNKITGDKKYNLIIVDGPFGGAQKLPRSNIVELIEHNLAQDFIIMFDDAERAGEQNTIAQTKAKLTSLGIKFGTQQRNALKSQILIFSKSCEFAKYL